MHKENIKLSVDGRVWINCNDNSFTGQGKIRLLKKIDQLGSLRKAAADMKMSYRQAWQGVNKMNITAKKPLVVLKRGGKDGGTAQITAYGHKIISAYNQLLTDFEIFLKNQSERLNI